MIDSLIENLNYYSIHLYNLIFHIRKVIASIKSEDSMTFESKESIKG